MTFINALNWAQSADQQDPLKEFRNQFLIPQWKGNDAIYLLGNSLGLQPKRTEAYIKTILDEWQKNGVEAFFRGAEPWLQYQQFLKPALAQIAGAEQNEIVVMNQLTVNLHLMMTTFYRPEGKRCKILTESKAFPSDQYMLHSHLRARGLNPSDCIIEVPFEKGSAYITEHAILKSMEACAEELCLVFFSGVNYYSGQAFPIHSITKKAHQLGAAAGFDLAHAMGNIPLQLHHWNVDFACWCSYKYLNSGPGGIAGTYIHNKFHSDLSLNRLAGWWGNENSTRFLMADKFVPENSADGWQLSTPSPVLYASHRAALDIFSEAGWTQICQKANKLSAYLFFVLNEVNKEAGGSALQIITPKTESERGCQASFVVNHQPKKVFNYLSEQGIFADWREPDVIRVAPVPLYNTFTDIWHLGQALKAALNFS